MEKRRKNYSGVPLGGIGAGKLEYCPDGAFRNVTFQNNMDRPVKNRELIDEYVPEGIEGCFFAAYVEGAGAVMLKENEGEGIKNIGKDSIDYNGHFPFVDAKYPSRAGVDISLEAFSPLVLDDTSEGYKDSSLPAASFTLKAVNNSSERKYVSLLFSWYNMSGIGGYSLASIKDIRGNTYKYAEEDSLKYVYLSHNMEKPDKRLNGNCSMILNSSDDIETSYYIYKNFVGYGIKQDAPVVKLFKYYDKDGRLPCQNDEGDDGYGALTGGKYLEPGEELEIEYILSWYYPEKTADGFNDIVYKNYYTEWFNDSLDVARYFIINKEKLYGATKDWQDKIFESNLPEWFKTKLINDIFPLYSNSMYLADGRFGSNEAPTNMCGCMGTIDQRAASNSIYTMCFPELSKSELSLFGDGQITEDHPERFGVHWDTINGTFDKEIDRLGAIFHDIGWDNLEGGRFGHEGWVSQHWPDLVSVFILQCYEHLIWTGDREFFDYTYPKIKLALRFEKELDQNDDGIAELWGPGSNTYDNENFPYYGITAFIGSLNLAAIKAAMKMAEYKVDKAYILELEEYYQKTAATFEEKLWDDELGYYLCWFDENYENWKDGKRPHKEKSDNCMVSQLAGQWFANMFNLGKIVNKKRIRSAMKNIAEKNVGLLDYCPANEVSRDNSFKSLSWPYYIETYFSANAIYEGLVDEGMEAEYKIYKAKYEQDGSPWDSPLAWQGEGNGEADWGKWYMTNPASWFLLLALTGFNYSYLDNELMFVPNIPSSLKELKSVPVFMPNFWLSISSDAIIDEIKVDRLIADDSINVKKVVTDISVNSIKFNDNVVEIIECKENENKKEFIVDLPLKSGDTLKLIKK